MATVVGSSPPASSELGERTDGGAWGRELGNSFGLLLRPEVTVYAMSAS